MKRLLHSRAGWFVVLAAALSAAGGTAAAQHPCSNSDYRGVFSALALGDFIAAPGGIPPGPTARIGRVEADGAGNARIHAVLALNGAIFEEDYGGVYRINPDCSMAVTLLIPFPGVPDPVPFRFSGMLSDGGREATILLLDPPGSTVRIYLRRQRNQDCADGDLQGDYALSMSGTNVFQPGIPPGPFARVGRIRFQRALGRIPAFAATAQASLGGQIVAESFSGIYTVDSRCLVTLTFATPGLSHRWMGMLMDNGAGVHLIVADPPGAVITGTLRQN